MNKSNVLSAFNNHLIELFDDINSIIPDNKDLKAAQTSLVTIKKVNPKIIIGGWKNYVNDKYKDDILSGNINFFLNKDYKSDLQDTEEPNTILEKIEILRKQIKELGEENQKKTLGYIQNLTKLCEVYYSS